MKKLFSSAFAWLALSGVALAQVASPGGSGIQYGASTTTVFSNGLLVNAIGDSEFGGQSFNASQDSYSYVPARVANKAYIVGNLYKDGGYMYRVTTGGTTANVAQGPSTSIGSGSITNGGTLYTAGTYNGVTLTGGTCTVAPTANVVVAVAAVSTVTIINRGLGCSINDVLTTAAANIGGTGSGFTWTVASLGNANGANSITDGTATVVWSQPQVIKTNNSPLFWMESWSLGKFRWDFEDGYQGPLSGTIKGFVLAGGSNYTANDTWTGSAGASGGFTVNAAGAITGVTVTNPGFGQVIHSYTISTASGSGASLSFVVSGSGTFSVNGAGSADMITYAQDAIGSPADILIVWSPTNDDTNITTYALGLTQYTATVKNLTQIYNAVLASGKKLIIMTPNARTPINVYQQAFLTRIKNWQLSYYQRMAWTNPVYYNNIAFVDMTRYTTDLTATGATAGQPIGGTTAPNGAMTYDGLHPSNRGAQYAGLILIDAASKWIGTNAAYANIVPRLADPSDWQDDLNNPGGNRIEAQPWVASETLAINQTRCNGGNFYYTFQAGVTASSGGPTGTGGGITDGGVKWNYSRPCYDSVMLGASTSLGTGPGSVTFVGNGALGYTLSRKNGTAAGTITGTVENPYSDGMIGQRQKLVFSLGSGTTNEQWQLVLPSGMKSYGYQAADFDSTTVRMCAEIEESGIANMSQIRLALIDPTSNTTIEAGENPQLVNNSGTHLTEMASTGEMLTRPVKELICTPAMAWPSIAFNPAPTIYFGFDASGGAGSATATIYINSISLRNASGG